MLQVQDFKGGQEVGLQRLIAPALMQVAERIQNPGDRKFEGVNRRFIILRDLETTPYPSYGELSMT